DAGSGVVWRHVVTNTGNWPIESVVVADDLEGSISCPVLPGEPSRLLPGQSVTCSLSGVARPLLGGVDHASTATVAATPLPPSTGTLASVADDDPTGHRVAVASIGDLVWSDTDVDGVQDPDEPGVPAVAVRLLDVDGLVVATTTTDATGRYRFDQLDPGTYQLEIVPPVDHFVTDAGRVFDDSVDSDADPATRRTPLTRLDGGETDTGWDVGLYRLASIGDRVWFDGDRDGVQDAGESAAVGTVVRLLTATGASLASTTTDVAGAYRFADLRPGAFVVQLDAPDGYAPTTADAVSPAAGDAPADPDAVDSDVSPGTGQSAVVVLVSGADERSVDVGIVEQASVGGRVWIDGDRDGALAPDELGPDATGATDATDATDAASSGLAVAGVVVLLLGPDGVPVDRTRPDDDGRYGFVGLDPGTYAVALGSPASAAGAVPVELAAGETESALDLALVPAADPSAGVTVPEATGGSVAAAAPSGGPTVVAGLPLTGGNVLQLVVFAAAVLLAGLLLLRARRPAGL
ncbi:MAG: SdrD B-like domain-containing protein, partial [Actinomycetes bacterium]